MHGQQLLMPHRTSCLSLLGHATRHRFDKSLYVGFHGHSADRRTVSFIGIHRQRNAICALAQSAVAAQTLAAAAVASAAGSGLGRLLPACAPVAITSATSVPTVNPEASVSAPQPPQPPPSASPPPSSPSLEGTTVPWVTLGPSLDLIQQRFRVGAATFRLVAPRDVDAVMDMYLEKGLLDADPYWTRAWPSAIALAATLLQRPDLVAGKVVADLGAGLGLAGMAAAMAGAKEVVLLDREPAALQCALLSAAATGMDSDPDPHNIDPDLHLDSESTRAAAARQRRRVEPLPVDQVPSYATLQLTPSYRCMLRDPYESYQNGGDPMEMVAQTAAAAVAAADEAGELHRHYRQQQQQQRRELEWKVLMALARDHGQRGAGSRGLTVMEPEGQVASTTGRNDGGGGSGDGDGGSTLSTTALMSYRSSPSSPSVAVGNGEAEVDSYRSGSSSSSSSGGRYESGSVIRAHVFDWTSPPAMERLLPPIHVTQPKQKQQGRRGRQGPVRQRRFDVVLACDVLYEDAAVGPIASLLPLLLEPDGGRLLLADPPSRTVRNRERFLEEVRSGPSRLRVEECSLQQCEVSKLDNEMAGGLAPTAETVPVQFLVFRSGLGNDTVGLKL